MQHDFQGPHRHHHLEPAISFTKLINIKLETLCTKRKKYFNITLHSFELKHNLLEEVDGILVIHIKPMSMIADRYARSSVFLVLNNNLGIILREFLTS